MENDYRDYTLTMAGVFAGQGHWEKAADIYRHLLRLAPDREDLKNLLADAESQAAAARLSVEHDLAPLFQKWFDLVFTARRIAALRRLAAGSALNPGNKA